MKRLAYFLTFLLLMASLCRAVYADARHLDKLRKFYREHNLDFFGELISAQEDLLTDEVRHAKLELLADDARTKALAQLEALLKGASGPMRAELLLRKATLLSDRSRTASYFQNNTVKSSRLASPQVYLKASIAVFSQIEREFPSHPRMDVVIFSIAYNHGELKDQDASYRYYDRLTARHPDSPLVGDARLAMAEILFDKRKFAQALTQLKEIVKAEDKPCDAGSSCAAPRLKNFALYKMAWTYYNMADLDSAITALEKVIDGVNNSGVARARLELRKEALHDLVNYYAERAGKDAPAQAPSYFERVAKTPAPIAADNNAKRLARIASLKARNAPIPDEDTEDYVLSEPHEMLFRLVQVYRDQGKHENSMIVAERLLRELEKHPRTVALYRLRAESAEKLRARTQVLSELERLAMVAERDLPAVSAYDQGLPEIESSGLGLTFAKEKAPAVKPAVLAESPDAAKLSPYLRELTKVSFEAFSDFSSFFHGEWSKTQDLATARLALSIYDLAIRVTLSPWRGFALEKSFAIRQRRAHLRFALKQWDLGAQDYHWLSTHANVVAGAGANILNDIKGEIASLEALLKDSPAKAASGIPLDPVHARLLAAYDLYLARFIEEPKMRSEVASVLSSSAHLHKDYGHLDDSLGRLMYYSRHFSDQKDAIAATRDILALLNKSSRWQDLRDFSEDLIVKGSYKKTEIDKELAKSYEYASLRLLEQLEQEKNWDKATKEFAAFAKKHPESSFVSQALIKSASAALQTKNIDSQVTRLEEATTAPDEKVRLQAWLGLEPFYRKAFLFKKLSALYEATLKLRPDAASMKAAQSNRAAVAELERESFAAAGQKLVASDTALTTAIAAIQGFETQAKPFRELRFTKSNNNPKLNFKKKADLHAAVSAAADAIVEKTAASLKAGTALWANLVKGEALIELAETIEQAALPAVLAQAQESDRKAYRETLSSQTAELRTRARELAVDTVKRLPKVDFPIALGDRLAELSVKCGEPRLTIMSPNLETLWAKNPALEQSEHAAEEREVDASIVKVGIRLLKTEDKDDARKLQHELVLRYMKSGEHGYAYAVAAALREERASDEWASKAARAQFKIDLARLPQRLTQGKTAADRWDLARWLAARPSNALGKNENDWAESMIRAALRSTIETGEQVSKQASNE